MQLDQLSPNRRPYAVAGLPTLYGGNGYWEAALPMPATATLLHSPTALPHPGRGHPDFAEPGEVPIVFENDDGAGDAPDPIMIDAARWLLANDAAVERAIIATMLADLPVLRDIQSNTVLGDEQPLPETWDEASLRAMIRLVYLTVPAVRGRHPYFGVEFACSWEREHGYGIMFHGLEIVETGGADVPNLAWIAARHAEGRGAS